VVNADVGLAEAPSETSGAPVGPSSEEEAMLLAEQGEMGEGSRPLSKTSAVVEIEDEKAQLPPMDDLIKRIPLPARETLEDLFRARFVTVKRIPKSALKN
jgi:hypothetical protein